MSKTNRGAAVLVFLLGVVLPVVTGFYLIPDKPVYVWLTIMAAHTACGLILGKKYYGSPAAVLVGEDQRISLSRLQMALWTVVGVGTISAFTLYRLHLGAKAAAFDFSIPEGLIALFGLTTGSTVASPLMTGAQDTTSQNSRTPSFLDLISDPKGEHEHMDLSRTQLLALTVIAIGGYALIVANTLADATKIADVSALPNFSGSLVTLLGVSHAGYLAGKWNFAPAPTPIQPQPEPKPEEPPKDDPPDDS